MLKNMSKKRKEFLAKGTEMRNEKQKREQKLESISESLENRKPFGDLTNQKREFDANVKTCSKQEVEKPQESPKEVLVASKSKIAAVSFAGSEDERRESRQSHISTSTTGSSTSSSSNSLMTITKNSLSRPRQRGSVVAELLRAGIDAKNDEEEWEKSVQLVKYLAQCREDTSAYHSYHNNNGLFSCFSTSTTTNKKKVERKLRGAVQKRDLPQLAKYYSIARREDIAVDHLSIETMVAGLSRSSTTKLLNMATCSQRYDRLIIATIATQQLGTAEFHEQRLEQVENITMYLERERGHTLVDARKSVAKLMKMF